ncbi:MAG: SLC13 family permease [Alphaproteobacteria bacterium]
MADLADIVRHIPLFSGLSREDMAKIVGNLEEESVKAGTTIFSQGDKGDAFYLIYSGAVRIVLESTDGRGETIAVLGPPQCFGEMALLSAEPRSATVIAVKDTTLWKLSREAWDDLIAKHPSWLLHFCAILSQRLSRMEKQYSQGRDAFNTLAEEFYATRPEEEQRFLRRASLLTTIDPNIIEFLLKKEKAETFLASLKESQLPLIRSLNQGYALHAFFRDFLTEKLLAIEGKETKQRLHAQLATLFAAHNDWSEAVHHCLEAGDWAGASRLLITHREELLQSSATLVKSAIERIPLDYIFSDMGLLHLQADTLARMGDPSGAARVYLEFLGEKEPALGADNFSRYRRMAEALLRKNHDAEALALLRNAVNVSEQQTHALSNDATDTHIERWAPGRQPSLYRGLSRRSRTLFSVLSGFYGKSSRSRWLGGMLGLMAWAYLWFGNPAMGLSPAAIKQLGLLCLTLIYWVFGVFPEYGVALLFALGFILTGLGKAEVVLGGFASTTWFMTLGVLGLGAAITSTGLFYRFSLQLVRTFPLKYNWQIIALGFMGIIVMALIPQQSARTAIISQMLTNLSESLGYKNPSKASTGLFVASFLGLGQLGFLFLTGSTTSLIAWGLLPAAVRSQFTWGYWFLAALVPTLVVAVVIVIAAIYLYQPESQPQISYKMVTTQLDILGPLSKHEWITLGVLCFTVAGWLTAGYHGIDGAWVSLLALCILINSGVLGWGRIKKSIDWEMLIYMGATLSIPTLLTQAKIDHWLVGIFSPLILPFTQTPALLFIIVVLITYAVKLVFTSFLTVVTLTIALLPLAADMHVNPWIVIMIILIASEVWFFSFQIDWHTLAYATTDGKGFSYRLMSRITPFYALAYVLALIVAIPYWRYLGLM